MWPNRRIIDLFKIEHPIVLGPMAGVADAALAIEVCEAGGLGSLPVATINEQQMREQVAKLVDLLQKQVDALKANPEVLRIPKQAVAIGKPFRAAAGAYGIADCENPQADAAPG